MKVNINEIFHSIQGEGRWAGHPAVFVRFQGCDIKCPFCDTAYAQECELQNQKKIKNLHTFCNNKNVEDWGTCSTEEVIDYVLDLISQTNGDEALQTDLVVFTGGEPFMQSAALLEIINGLSDSNRENIIRCHIETSGTQKVTQEVRTILENNYVTLSPKHVPPKLPYCIKADEIKMLVAYDPVQDIPIPEAVTEFRALERTERIRFQPIWIDDANKNEKATERAIQKASQYGGCVSFQLHKFMGIR